MAIELEAVARGSTALLLKSVVFGTEDTRILLDNLIFSSWVNAKTICGYKTDSEFASHFLSLERW